MKVSARVTFDTSIEEHTAVIAWLDKEDNRAAAIRTACIAYANNHIGNTDLLSTLQGIQNAVTFLERELAEIASGIRSGGVMGRGGGGGGDSGDHSDTIPQNIVANFDNIGV